jgi:hypothetical protein
MKQEIDLEHHLLYTAFKNKFITPEDQESTQQIISRLMVDYPQVFPSSTKISYAISMLKTEGLIYEELRIDKEAYDKCVEDMRQKHPRMGEESVRTKCLKKIGYKSILMPTELGIIEYCSKTSRYIKDKSTKTNIIIIDVCKTYSQGEQLWSMRYVT